MVVAFAFSFASVAFAQAPLSGDHPYRGSLLTRLAPQDRSPIPPLSWKDHGLGELMQRGSSV